MKKQISQNHKAFSHSRIDKIFLLTLSAVAIFMIAFIGHKYLEPRTMSATFRHVNEKPESNICVIVESGHGGINDNVYLTAGKQSPEWADGLKIYEGYSCKMLATDFICSLLDADIDAFLLNSEVYDYSNIVRAERVNSWLKLDSRIIFISLHHNAQPTDKADYTDRYGVKGYIKNGASGIEIFTTIGKTKSDLIADYIYTELHNEFTDLKFRCDWTDKDADKEANFTVLVQTNCPAILIEFMFMTTYSDCKIIADKNYRKRYIEALTRAMKSYNQSIK